MTEHTREQAEPQQAAPARRRTGRRAAASSSTLSTVGDQTPVAEALEDPAEATAFMPPLVEPSVQVVESSAAAPGQLVDGEGRGVLLVSSDPRLRQLLTGVCASAAARLRWMPTMGESGFEQTATTADMVLLDARDLRREPLEHCPPTADAIVLGTAENTDLWELAAALGDCSAAVLPEAEAWLAERIAGLETLGGHGRAAVLGVIGAVGGVGASTLACWMAAQRAEQGQTIALVDADPDSCGLDLLLGLELEHALRWPDLVGSQGQLSPERMWEVLPSHPELPWLRWLSWGREPGPLPEVPTGPVLRALRGACDGVVVDLGPLSERSLAMAGHCDAVLVAMPRTVRGSLALERILARLRGTPVEAVLCGPAISDAEEDSVEEFTGVRPLARVLFDARMPEASEAGRILERGRRRQHAVAVAQLWQLLEELHGMVSAEADEALSAAGARR